ncbi:MAG: DNA methyltransferase [Anaerolineae bacterium]
MSPREVEELIEAIHSREQVTGYTHGFYRYPARFSPLFVRAIIKSFTNPGDVILDPFMGGGTTLVEARALGRMAIGVDTNSLAVFISKMKTTLFSDEDLSNVRRWANTIVEDLNLRALPVRATEWIELGYQRNINTKLTWPTRKIIELVLAQLDDLPNDLQKDFVRGVLLKTAQWALDCRSDIPSAGEFRRHFLQTLDEMINDAREYAENVINVGSFHKQSHPLPVFCLHRSVIGIETDDTISKLPSPKLILTSPPYPGIHVLYHRWQIQGRRETPAPYWIADCLDGDGASFYTLGDRKQQGLVDYFEQTRAAFASLAKVASDKTIVVQMVAFTDPTWQLSKYLSMMTDGGFQEVKLPKLSNSTDGRIWRGVPNRKWYASQMGETAASKEVVLFHKLR